LKIQTNCSKTFSLQLIPNHHVQLSLLSCCLYWILWWLWS